MRGLPKVIGQGIYKREDLLRVPEYAGGWRVGRARENERVVVACVCAVWCVAAAAAAFHWE